MKAFLHFLWQFAEIDLEIPNLVLITIPSGSTQNSVAFLYSLPSVVLKSSANAADAKHEIKIAKAGTLI